MQNNPEKTRKDSSEGDTLTASVNSVDEDNIRLSRDLGKIGDDSISDSLLEEKRLSGGKKKLDTSPGDDHMSLNDSFNEASSTTEDFARCETHTDKDKSMIRYDVMEEIPSEQVLKTIFYDTLAIDCEDEGQENEDVFHKPGDKEEEEDATELNKENREETLDEEYQEDDADYWLSVPRKAVPVPSPESMTDEESEAISFKKTETDKDDRFVSVKFKTDSNETMTSAFKIHTKIYEVKERLASIFKLKVDDIRLNYEDDECDDVLPLSGLGVEALGSIELGVQSTDPNRILAPGQFRHYIPVVDVITVRIPKDEGGFKDVVVEIENQSFVKEWLGGYRHRITKIEYYHATIQTMPRQRDPELPPLFSRDTQTPNFPLKVLSINTNPSKSTQMWRTDHFIPNETDKIIIAHPEQFKCINGFQLLAKTVKKIQRFGRKVIAEKKQKLAEEMERKLWENEVLVKKQKEKTARENDRRLILGTTFPLKRGDFYMLYLMIGKWWKNEIEKIKKLKLGESRKAAYLDLLEREITFLSVIEKQRIEVKKEILHKKEMEFLSCSARPIIFRNHKGLVSTIDTVQIQQARELQEILSSFLNRNVTLEERLDVLFTLKNLLNKYGSYEYSDEIVKLLTREAELLSLGMKGKQLDGLRDRSEQLIMFYVHQYDVNPSGKNYRKPNFPKTDSTLYQCTRCKKLKPACDYNIHVRMTSFSICHSCEWIRNIAHQRIDLTPYYRMLQQVRVSELQNCCYSSNSYVLQAKGMYYLTHHIWNDKSVLSGANNLNNLRSVRFIKNIDWSPWNCILLTEEESEWHLSINNVIEFYDEHFIEKIKWRHDRARNIFLPLVLKDMHLCESQMWFNVQDSGAFIHPSHITEFLQDEDFERNF